MAAVVTAFPAKPSRPVEVRDDGQADLDLLHDIWDAAWTLGARKDAPVRR